LRLGLFGALQDQIDIRPERSPPRLLVREELGRYAASHTTVPRNRATTGGGVDNSGLGRAELDYSTLNDPAGGGIVNNGSTVHLKNTVVDEILYIDLAA
jgi:hypothetical protein